MLGHAVEPRGQLGADGDDPEHGGPVEDGHREQRARAGAAGDGVRGDAGGVRVLAGKLGEVVDPHGAAR